MFVGKSKYQKNKSVYNKLKGDDRIKIILKFVGAGVKNNYQVDVKVYGNNEKIIDTKTYNGEICVILEKNKVYRLEYSFLNIKKIIYFYTNSNKYIFNLNQNSISIITFSLKDYYYNIPIEKGEIILWQR